MLFGGDPTRHVGGGARGRGTRGALVDRSPSGDLGDVVELLVRVGLGTSKGDVRRTLEGAGYRCNGVVLDRRHPARRSRRCCTGATCCCSADASRTTLSRFFPDHGLWPSTPVRVVFHSAPRTAFAPPEEQSTKPAGVSAEVRELRLLENGREDRTPVRAVQSGEAIGL